MILHVSVVSGVLSVMFLVCDLVSVVSGVLSVMSLVCDLACVSCVWCFVSDVPCV